MTKLLEWLFGAVLLLGPWMAVVTNIVVTEVTNKYFTLIFFFPIILVALFGIFSLWIIAYRVYTFNDCKEAEAELRRQIKEAKSDLIKKGLKFS